MTQLLISVTSVDEALMALEFGTDIIDLKDPARGALGALPIQTIKDILDVVNSQKIVSATIGDIGMQPKLLIPAVVAIVELNVDYIKIGFLPSDDTQLCLNALQPIVLSGAKLIAVLFAEFKYDVDLIQAIKAAGFIGIMLDTAEKNGLSLFDHFTQQQCKIFAQQVSEVDLVFGLAGSLKLEHIAQARLIKPHYIGLRGGVCLNNQRQLVLDPKKILAIRNALSFVA